MSVSRARRAELEAELLKTMDRLDELRVEQKEAQAAARKEAALTAQKIRDLRDILSGREGDQTSIPGTEVGTVKPRKAAPAKATAGKSPAGITWTAEDDDSRTGRSRSQARVYRVSAVRVTATGRFNWGWHLPGSALHHGGQSGYDTAPAAMAAAERHELHYWPREPKKATPRPAPLKKSEAKAMRDAADEFVAQLRKGEITRWAADAKARKVPLFVIEMTGLKAKAQVVTKYGDTCVFEKGKPCPKPLGQRPGDLASKRRPARPSKADTKPMAKPFEDVRWVTEEDGSVKGIASDGLVYEIEYHKTPDLRGYRWKLGEHRASGHFETITDAQEDGIDCDRIRQGQPKREVKPKPFKPQALSWTEGDGTLQVVAGSTTYRVQEITPTRWVLESKSERERAWHKEDVLPHLAACEGWVIQRHPGATFDEPCLSCGVPANQPSEGCEECQHGRSPPQEVA